MDLEPPRKAPIIVVSNLDTAKYQWWVLVGFGGCADDEWVCIGVCMSCLECPFTMLLLK